MTPHRLSRRDARRIAVRAQLLAAPRPTDLLGVLRHLGSVQVDLTAAVAPSADLVLRSRLGHAYAPDDLAALLVDRAAVELRGILRPAEDIALHGAEMASRPGVAPLRDWQRDNAAALDRLDAPAQRHGAPADDGRPRGGRCFVQGRPRAHVGPRGPGVSGHRGRSPTTGTGRTRPAPVAVPRSGTQRGTGGAGGTDARRRRRRAGGDRRRPWHLAGRPDQLAQPFRGRAALLSPLDRLLVDRRRLAELFEFDYQLEMYKPAAKRRWGYYALPLLYGDRLVGKLDASADRRAGVLRLNAVHEDVPFTDAMRRAVAREVRGLADLLQLEIDPTESVAGSWLRAAH